MDAMKYTGITRPVDNLGRIVIPIELRRSMNIEEGDRLEIFVHGDNIVLVKTVLHCAVCGTTDGDMHLIGDWHICRDCAQRIVDLIGGAGPYAATP